MMAAAFGSVEELKRLISIVPTIDVQDKEQRTPLIHAVLQNRLECVIILVRHGANANLQTQNGWTALYIAANKGLKNIALFLLNTNADEHDNPTVSVDTANSRGATPLMMACSRGSYEISEALIKKNADINFADHYGWTPIMKAADNGHLHIVELLASNGARLNDQDKQGSSALMKAASKGYVDIVNYLIMIGADVLQHDKENLGAIHVAAKEGKPEVLDALISSKAHTGLSVDSVTLCKRTALYYAVQYRHTETVGVLLRHGADLYLPDKDGATALSIADSNEIADMLFNHKQPSRVKGEPEHEQVGSIQYGNIPEYLQKSAFFASLDAGGGIIDVPTECYVAIDRVYELADVSRLLRVANFWGLERLPTSLCHYLITHLFSEWREQLVEELPVSVDLTYIFASYAFDTPMIRSIEVGRTEFIELFVVLRLGEHVCAMTAAAKAGRLDYMKLFLSRNYSWDCTTCSAAALAGHIECLIFAHDNHCAWDYSVYCCAIVGNHRECILFACQKGLPWHVDVCITAVRNNSVTTLHFLRENGCPWNEEVTRTCAAGGHTECLEYALSNGCPIESVTACRCAYEGRHLNCLMLIWSARTCKEAALQRDLPFLHYLHTNKCPWDSDTTDTAALCGEYFILCYALIHGCPYNDNLIVFAVCSGSLDCVRFLVENLYCLLCQDTQCVAFGTAFQRGDLVCMTYLLNAGCMYKEFTFSQDRKEPFLSRTEWDARLQRCIVFATTHGWEPCVVFENYLRSKELLLCLRYLGYS